MCLNWTTYILSIEPNKETSVSYKGPLSPNDSNATSTQHWTEPAHEWGLFSQHFAEWRPCRRQGHFNRPFSTPRPPNEHSGHRGRVTFTASQRVKDGGGGGRSERQGVPLCWLWWMSGSQQGLEKAFASTQEASQMTWVTPHCGAAENAHKRLQVRTKPSLIILCLWKKETRQLRVCTEVSWNSSLTGYNGNVPSAGFVLSEIPFPQMVLLVHL